MISEHFDTRTRINMKLALDRVCRHRPGGEDHGFRSSVAENIIRCALTGRTGIGQLVDAGERAMITDARGAGAGLIASWRNSSIAVVGSRAGRLPRLTGRATA